MAVDTGETWKPVVGFEGFYEVSDRGRVRSLDRTVQRGGHSVHRRGKVLRQTVAGRYLSVNLARDGGFVQTRVHRMVLEAFVGPAPEDKPYGLHWDDDYRNNQLENLRWGSLSENGHDNVRNGRHPNARKTHCAHGHEFTPENTITRVRPNGVGRRCRACRDAQNAISNAKKKKKVNV